MKTPYKDLWVVVLLFLTAFILLACVSAANSGEYRGDDGISAVESQIPRLIQRDELREKTILIGSGLIVTINRQPFLHRVARLSAWILPPYPNLQKHLVNHALSRRF